MKRCKLKNGGRQKAFAGAAIMAGASLLGSIINGVNSANAASANARAQLNVAQMQADAIQESARLNAESQQKAFEQQANLYKQNSLIQTTNNLNTVLQNGQMNTDARRQASRIQLKQGGAINSRFLLRGSSNAPFTVTDGGGVIPMGVTPEGNMLYKIIGDTHNQYHNAPDGKRKTGVGFKFSNGKVIEAENNEDLIIDPNNNEAMILSAHKLKGKKGLPGINPSQLVDAGYSPEMVFAIQQKLNNNNGSSPVEEMKCGGRVKLKCGGRRKAANGYWQDYGGATINGIANLAGAGITSLFNYFGANRSINANNQAADILSKAYGNLKTIDDSFLNDSAYRAPVAIAALRAPIVDTSTERAAIERARSRQMSNISRSTLSGAAMQNRFNTLNTNAVDQLGAVESNANKIREQIGQENANRLTSTSVANAQIKATANDRLMQSRLALAQYNNDINNRRIMGIGQTRANALSQNAAIKAGMQLANAQSFASALNNTAQSFNSAHDAATERDNILMGQDLNRQIAYAIRTKNDTEAKRLFKLIEGTTGTDYDNYRRMLQNSGLV